MSNYSNALVEVDTILDYLDEEDFQKIPPKVIYAIKENKSNDYFYNLNANLDLRKQKMLPETKAILFNLFRDYLSTPEQKEKIIKMQREDRIKAEEKKKQEYQKQMAYTPDELFKDRQKPNARQTINENIETNQMIQYKESMLTRIINKIKNFFHRK